MTIAARQALGMNLIQSIKQNKQKAITRGVIRVLTGVFDPILLMSEDVSIKVQYEYYDLEIGQLCIDVYIFMEVMENIVANALRYAKEKIDVKIQKDGKFLKLLIMDDGKGFSERDIIHACRPYYREQSDEDTQHYGLGLYICKVLCEKHGGSIELGNNKFGGGCVQVIFNIEE